MIFRSPAAPDPARRSKIDTFNKARTRQHKQPEDHIARTRGHTGPSCNNTKGISKDNTKLEWSSSDWAWAGHERSCLLVVLPVIYLACASHLCCCLPDRRPKWLLGGWVGGLVAEEEEEEEEWWWWWWCWCWWWGRVCQFYIYKFPIDRLSGCYWYNII